MDHLLFKKFNRGHFRGIINIILFIMLLLFLFFVLSRVEARAETCDAENCEGCLIASDCLATDYCLWDIANIPMCFANPDIILIGFEPPNYFLGDLHNQQGWISDLGDNRVISGGYQGVQSVLLGSSYASRIYKIFTPAIWDISYVSFYFSITDYPRNWGEILFIIQGGSKNLAWCKMKYTPPEDSEKLFCSVGSEGWWYVGTPDKYLWNKISFMFNPDTDEYKWQWAYENWSAWHSTRENFDNTNYISFSANATNELDEIVWLNIDEIQFGSIGCSHENCGGCHTNNECLGVGCFWHEPTGNCLSYQLGICGGGANLVFCKTQEDCDFYGGYWNEEWLTCFFGDQTPPPIIDFIEYHKLHSDYPPTEFIQGLVNFTTPIIEIVGSFLVSFQNIFNLQTANEKGALYGSTIPQIRGHLATINDFFSGLPIGEGLLIFVSALLIVGIFRIVVKLVHIVKP